MHLCVGEKVENVTVSQTASDHMNRSTRPSWFFSCSVEKYWKALVRGYLGTLKNQCRSISCMHIDRSQHTVQSRTSSRHNYCKTRKNTQTKITVIFSKATKTSKGLRNSLFRVRPHKCSTQWATKSGCLLQNRENISVCYCYHPLKWALPWHACSMRSLLQWVHVSNPCSGPSIIFGQTIAW